jgi:hypothetical protein
MIRIKTCKECPYLGHKGAFGEIAYVPVCRKSGKELPHTLGAGHKHVPLALGTNAIPEWCPLDALPVVRAGD